MSNDQTTPETLAIVRKSDLLRYLAEDPGTPAGELKVGDHLLVVQPAKADSPFKAFVEIAEVWRIETLDDGRVALGVWTTGLGGCAWTHVCTPDERLHVSDPAWTVVTSGAQADARGQESASCLCGCPLGRNCRCDDDVDHGDPRDPEGWAR